MSTTATREFTIHSLGGPVLLTTDDEALARLSVLRGHRVTTVKFGETVTVTFALTPVLGLLP